MAQTFRDFIVECELYPYSKQRYDFLKECYEIDMMQHYLENVEVANSRMWDEDIQLTEGYMQESVDNMTYQAISESLGSKIKALGGKFVNGVKKLWNTVVNFFKRIFGKAKDKITFKREVKKTLTEVQLDQDEVKALTDIVASTRSEYANYGIVTHPSIVAQPALSELKIRYKFNPNQQWQSTKKDNQGNDLPPMGKKIFENTLAALLSESTVKLHGTDGTAVAPDVLLNILSSALAISPDAPGEAVVLSKKLSEAQKTAKDKGFIIPAGSEQINALMKELGDLDGKIGEAKKANVETTSNGLKNVNSYGAQDAASGFGAAFDDLYTELSKAVASTMKVINGWEQYQSACLSKMKTWADNRKKDSGETYSSKDSDGLWS